MALNLNNPADFASLTGAGAATVANLLGENPIYWKLEEASYNGVKFHILESESDYNAGLRNVSDKGGRRVGIIEYAYKDGQTTDDLGRKGGSYTFNGVIFGINYLSGMQSLQVEFNKSTPGVLIHPVRGELKGKIVDVDFMHESSSRQATIFKFTFLEHDFDVGSLEDLTTDNLGSLLSSALNIISGITGVINIVNNSIALGNAVKASITNYLNVAEDSTSLFLVSANTNFNESEATNYQSLLPVNDGGNRNADGSLNNTVYIAGSSTPVPIPLSSIPSDFVDLSTVDNTGKKVQNDLIQARSDLQTCIQAFIDEGVELDFYKEILFLTESAVELQKVYEVGLKSSKKTVFDYEIPYDMSLFNAGFLNGISTERIVELSNLNNDLESILWITKGTVIKMPTT